MTDTRYFDDYLEESGFEERADYISDDYIMKWNVNIPHFESIQKKLIDKGAKVMVGPRGTGKTHQMKIAYRDCLENQNNPMAVYVSFSKYYHLEPLLSKNPAAIIVFHTWVLSKILLGCIQLLEDMKVSKEKYTFKNIEIEDIKKFVAQSEKNIQESWHSEIINNITIQFVLGYITDMEKILKRKRTVLLLDDAALTLTKEYMIEFFDIFRSLKTTKVSPKASVYPGTTEYGPRFHLKQDGDPFNVWFEPDGEEYTDFIDLLFEKRFQNIDVDQNIKELLKYASFGNPRAFITLLRDYEEDDAKTTQATFNKIINMRCELIKAEYLSIKQKLNQYSTIIDTGWNFFEVISNEITIANRSLVESNSQEKQLVIGLQNQNSQSIDRMIKFLIEAGLLFELSTVKHGESREYKRYIPHLMFLFQKKAFSKSRGFNTAEIVDFLKRKNSKHPLRKDNIYSLLSKEEIDNLKLDLPPCTNCGTPRLSENQKFCHACGQELVSKSSFEECMRLTIDDLPLTDWQKNKLKAETNLRTVEDFMSMRDISGELTKPKGFGKKKAANILSKIHKYIEEFLA